MKKILLFAIPAMLLLASCTKETYVQQHIDESQWLYKPAGRVVESSFNCDYFIIQNNYGYSVLRLYGGAAPYPGSVIYGYHDRWGTYTFYNRSDGYLFTASVQDYGRSYFTALDLFDWHCSY